MMKYSSLLISPKKEEALQVPDTGLSRFCDAKRVYGDEEMHIMDELEGFLGIEEEEEEEKKFLGKSMRVAGRLNWDSMEWEEEDEQLGKQMLKEETHYGEVIKAENFGFWDGEKMSLNLNLNYQEVLEAWSDRGSLWADDCPLSIANTHYVSIQFSFLSSPSLQFSFFPNLCSVPRSDLLTRSKELFSQVSQY